MCTIAPAGGLKFNTWLLCRGSKHAKSHNVTLYCAATQHPASSASVNELGRLGAHPALILGMRGGGEAHEGHAWVEVDGRAPLDPDLPTQAWVEVRRYGSPVD